MDNFMHVELYKKMLKIRTTEELLAFYYKEQEMRTPTHFGTGQEAVAVGVCAALRKEDVVFSHHRCHNHYLAKGGSVFELASELYGRSTGCSGGRGGSVHLTDIKNGLIATSAILGETPAVATGAALSFKMDRLNRVAVTFFGEGAMDEGAMYECFNFASIHKLPVIFVCENNLYATESPLSVRQADNTDLCERVRSFKIDSKKIDGNDVLCVYETTKHIVNSILNGNGPYFLECMTYRWREHVGPMFDYELNRTYRSQEELNSWINKCPLSRMAKILLEERFVTQEELDRWSEELSQSVNAEIMQAKSSPWPHVDTLFSNI